MIGATAITAISNAKNDQSGMVAAAGLIGIFLALLIIATIKAWEWWKRK